MAPAPKNKPAMGRGLSALLKDPENDIKSAQDKNADKILKNMIELDLKSIEANPFQPRDNFKEEELKELASSIKELGVIQPITVRKVDFNKYQIISGERRFRASSMVGLETIPAYIRIANDQEILEMALVENIQRSDLDPIEISLSYQRLIDEIKLTQEDLSKRVGKKRSTITNYLRLLKLNPIIQMGMRDGFLSMGHGRALINIDDIDKQLNIYKEVIAKDLSVRDTENIVREYKENKGDKPKSKETSKPTLPDYINYGIGSFQDFFDAKVNVSFSSKSKGKLTIPFKSQKDFERMVNLLKSDK